VIDQRQRRNPLRWALLLLLVGIVVVARSAGPLGCQGF